MSLKGIFVVSGVPETKVNVIKAQLQMLKNQLRVTKKETNAAIFSEAKKQNFNTFNPRKLNQDIYQYKIDNPQFFFKYIYTKQDQYFALFQTMRHQLFIPSMPDFYGKVSFSNDGVSVSKQYLLEFLLSLSKNYKCAIYIEFEESNQYYGYHINGKLNYYDIPNPNLHNKIEYEI